MAYFQIRDWNELKKHLNKPVKLTTIDGKLFEGILGHVDEQNIHIVVPINIGSNHINDIGTDHVGDIYSSRPYSPYAPSYATGYGAQASRYYSSVGGYNTMSSGYYGHLTLPLVSLAGLSDIY